jgi:hypothetical protein
MTAGLARHGCFAPIWRGLKGEPAIWLEEQFKEIAEFVALAIEAGAVLVVAFGAFQALASVVAAVITRTASEMRGRQI